MTDLIQTRTSLITVTGFEFAGALDTDEAIPSGSCSLDDAGAGTAFIAYGDRRLHVDDFDLLETLIVATKTHRDALRPTPTKRSS